MLLMLHVHPFPFSNLLVIMMQNQFSSGAMQIIMQIVSFHERINLAKTQTTRTYLIIVFVDTTIVADYLSSFAGVEFGFAEIRRPHELVGVERLFLLLLSRVLLRERIVRLSVILFYLRKKIFSAIKIS